ncbi:hypothetical protein GCM10012275_53240 [Longimycelium tulufanense]|uniref:Uncharacterized protein n=1 Tax=Longimycelium tulufanense TaxID=907463 RepID=A0A8J3FWC2_9PSEU|nr:hypothetical protein [Longimycelium tulufanense]GGM75838.1 hypothetical protein GCM10012275_53240 [Longimycelium tulufanense]
MSIVAAPASPVPCLPGCTERHAPLTTPVDTQICSATFGEVGDPGSIGHVQVVVHQFADLGGVGHEVQVAFDHLELDSGCIRPERARKLGELLLRAAALCESQTHLTLAAVAS